MSQVVEEIAEARRRRIVTASERMKQRESTVLPVAFGAAFRQMLLHDGFFAGLLLEDAAERFDF